MDNHYETLGLKNSASQEEIRRAYRILARRYHPDVNPGKTSEERFKKIAAAYAVLSDPKRKAKYDAELEGDLSRAGPRGFQAYQRAQEREFAARKRNQVRNEQHRRGARTSNVRTEPRGVSRKGVFGDSPFHGIVSSVRKSISKLVQPSKREPETFREAGPRPAASETPTVVPRKVSVLEVSLSIRDAIYGVKRSVEVTEPEGTRKISVTIPAGVRNGSVIRMKGKSSAEELVIIIRLATHPFLSIQTRGLVAEIPVTASEALTGASITVPTLDEPAIIKIPPGSQSGTEIRLPEKGLFFRDNGRGDLFIRLMVHVPESPEAVGVKGIAAALDQYYEEPVRSALPKTLAEAE